MIALILLALAAFVTVPLRRPTRSGDEGEDFRTAELEARKEAKYREIRDAEMDRESGKLTEEEWRRIDRELRREAIQILREVDRVGGTNDKQ